MGSEIRTPDDRIDAANNATETDARALEDLAARVGIEIENNYLRLIADPRESFPAGKEHAANAQARFVRYGDPVDEYTDPHFDGFHGVKALQDGSQLSADRLAFVRANLIAGIGGFTDPRNVRRDVMRVYPEDLPTAPDVGDTVTVSGGTFDGSFEYEVVDVIDEADHDRDHFGPRITTDDCSEYPSWHLHVVDDTPEIRTDGGTRRGDPCSAPHGVDCTDDETFPCFACYLSERADTPRRVATDGGEDIIVADEDDGAEVLTDEDDDEDDDIIVADGGWEPPHDARDDYDRFAYPPKAVDADADPTPVAERLRHTDHVIVGYESKRTNDRIDLRVSVDEVVALSEDADSRTYWFAGNPDDRDADRYDIDFGSVTARDTNGDLYRVGTVRYVDVPRPTCESCSRPTVETEANHADRVCTFCGCFTDHTGSLPRSDDKRCGTCHGPVAYGPYKDARHGIRGYWCPSCDLMVRTEDEAPVATDGGITTDDDVTVYVETADGSTRITLSSFESGFAALLIASSRSRIESPTVDDDTIDGLQNALMSCHTNNAPEIRTDGGTDKPPGEDLSLAPNYKAGGVWFTLGPNPRLLLSPSDARALADELESRPAFNAYEDDDRYGMTDAVDTLRDLADEVEDAVDDPDPSAFDSIPLTDPDGDGAGRTYRGP